MKGLRGPLISIDNGNEIWNKTWNLYVTVAQNSTTNDSKRHALLQLAEDVKEQYTKTIEQEEVQKSKSYKPMNTSLKWSDETSISRYGSKKNSLLLTSSWFYIVIFMSVILIPIVMFSDNIPEKESFKDINQHCSRRDRAIVPPTPSSAETMTNSSLLHIFPVPASIYFRRSYFENKKLAFIDSIYDSNGVNNKAISAFSSLTPPETTSSTYPSTETTTIYETGSSTSASTTDRSPAIEPHTKPKEFEEPSASSEDKIVIPSLITTSETISIKPEVQDRIIHNSILVVLISLFLLIFHFIISSWLKVRQILIYICYIPCRLYRLVFTHSQNIHVPLIHKIEKLALLDSMERNSHLSRLFEDKLLVYSSMYDCFHDLDSNHLQDYILFLSLTDFEVHSFELERLSNVSLCIFYEDNDHSRPHISKTKYHIRFIFPKACLLEYLRHAIILNYAKQAHMYRVEGLERAADENYLAASRECHRLADELEQQSSTTGGREPEESLSYNSEDMDDRYLR